jgi:nucleotide-binding universal stress UspA family protein
MEKIMANKRSSVPLPRGARGRFSKIVVGTSLTPESDEIVRLALAVCRALGSRAHLVHGTPIEPVGCGFDGVFGVEIMETLTRQRESELARQIHRTQILDDELVGAEVFLGAPHQVLASVAREAAADLIIVGALDDHGSGRQLLGSTADRLIRSAHCPILILRNGMILPPLRVLAPVDFSSTSARAVDAGVDLLRQMNADGVTTIQSLFVLSELTRQLASQFSPQQVDRMAKEELLRFTFEHTEGWEGTIETKVRIGDARHQLLKELDDCPVDLVVMGSHGHGRLHRALIGSVAGRIARRASCSVLFVPKDEVEVADKESTVTLGHVDLSRRIEQEDSHPVLGGRARPG